MTTTCPGCSGAFRQGPDVDAPGLGFCARCGGLIGEASRAVLARYIEQPFRFHEGPEPDEADIRYFDVVVTDYVAGGPDRVHGWYSTRSKRVTQFG